MPEGIVSIIAQLEHQKTAIERALLALRDVEGVEPPATTAIPAATGRATGKGAGRNRRSLAQKKRWAARRATEGMTSAVPTTSAPHKGGMTEDGRRRLAEAMKRRWAVKRAASALKKRTGRRKKAA